MKFFNVILATGWFLLAIAVLCGYQPHTAVIFCACCGAGLSTIKNLD